MTLASPLTAAPPRALPPSARPTPLEAAMALLNSGVPLSLLLDLALGPCSEQLLDEERVPMPRSAAS